MPATHSCPEPEQSSPCPIHPTSWKIHLNIILSIPASSKWSLSFRFLHQNPVCTSPLLHTSTCPSHVILIDLITQVIFGKENRSLRSSLCTFLHNPSYLIPLRLKYSPQHPIVTHPQPTFLPQCDQPCFTPMQNNMQNAVYINLFVFW